MDNEWRPARGYEGYYVSSAGEMIGKRGHLLKQGTDKHGYKTVMVRKNGKNVHRYVHCIVIETFVGPRPVGKQTAHNNGIPSDNRVSNLRWATPKENMQDKNGHGTNMKKLTAEQVADIKLRLAARHKVNDIAHRYDVSPENIRAIKTGRIWSHILPEVEIPQHGWAEEVVEAISAGESIGAVAEKYELHISTVSRMFERHTGMSIRAYRQQVAAC